MAKLELEDIFGAFAESTKEYIDEVKRRGEEMKEKNKKLEKENEELKEQIKIHSTIYRACPDRNCKYSRLIFIKRPGTPKGKGTAVCGLGWTEEDCDKLKERYL